MVDRIAIFHEPLIPPGGAERLALEEAKYFAKRLETKLFTFTINDKISSYTHNELGELEILEVRKSRMLTVLGHVLGNSISQAMNQTFTLRARLLKFSPDIVIGCTWGGWLQLYFATLFTPMKYVLHIHGTSYWFGSNLPSLIKYSVIHGGVFAEAMDSVRGHREFNLGSPKFGFPKRLFLEFFSILDFIAVRKARGIVVLTPQVQWEVKKLYGKHSVVAKGCLDPSLFTYKPKTNPRQLLGIGEDTFVFLSVSRLEERKRIDRIVEAFAKFSPHGKDSALLIVGIGAEEGRLKELAETLGCSSRIKFAGFVPDESLWDYYHACDVFVFAGWSTSPITTYEALACGKNVIWSSEADEPPEIMESPQIIFTNPDPDSLASSFVRAYQQRNWIKTDVSKFTWDNYFNTVRELLSSVSRGASET